MASPFQGATFALLTLHGKQHVMAPVLWERLKARILHTDAYDTDALGTFSGEIERVLEPADCARKKAELACALTGCAIGLGSEGSFSPGPFGLSTFNEELVACVNIEDHWTVTGRSYQPCTVRGQQCQDAEELAAFIGAAPSGQGFILKAQGHIGKGLAGAEAVHERLRHWFGGATQWPLSVTYDLRAHHCPERRERIAKATENLAERLLSGCPGCGRPGFWPDEALFGLPCRWCGTPTHAIMQRRAVCQSCRYQQVFAVGEPYADPADCPECNP